MKLDARMLNLLGLLAIVAVLGLGVVSLIMPMYQGVQNASGELSLAEQTNEGYRNQLAQLAEAESRKAEIEKSVAELRKEMPDNLQADTVLQVIADASTASGTFIDADSYAAAVAFAPQLGVQGEEVPSSAPAPPPDPAADTASGAGAESADTTGADPAAPAEGGSAATGPEQQVEIELTVSALDHAMATSFLDQLRAGPRSLLVTSAVFEKGSAHTVTGWEGTLKVKMLAFFYESGDTK